MYVRIPTPLRSYTNGEARVTAHGGTVDEILLDLERQFAGFRFRMVDEQNRLRKHVRVFINDDMITGLSDEVTEADEVTILQALSGGSETRAR
jgi:sulfur-carrier protein